MTDIFESMAEKSGHTDSSRYGLSGDMKKTQYVLELIGSPFDAETLKCIITAAEQGMEMNCYSMESDSVDNMDEGIEQISPLSIKPCLKEADFFTCGGEAITAFINARGLGYSLTPKNVSLAAMQDYWVDIANTNVAPLVNAIVQEKISKKYSDSSYTPDDAVIKENVDELNIYLDALSKQLKNNKYIVCDKYTWADLHWSAYIYLCEAAGITSLLESRPDVQSWFARIKTRKSQCGQDIVALDFLPNAEEISQGKLKSVEISDF